MTNITPVLYMPIGPSGSGKSTLYAKMKEKYPNLLIMSKDVMRIQLYGNDYDRAWIAANNDPQFKNNLKDAFLEMLKSRNSIFVDNTNLSPKVRQWWLNQAKAAKYITIAIVFDTDNDTLWHRRNTRTDRITPPMTLDQQIQAFKAPINGEFDYIFSSTDMLSLLK